MFERFTPTISINPDQRTVTVSLNVSYGTLCGLLHDSGFALHNLGSLAHISVIGACATATHGSGDRNKNLASAVTALTFIAANGDLVTASRTATPEIFNGTVVNLGALGVIVSLTLELQPRFSMSQTIYESLPHAQVYEHFDAIMSSAYSVSLFTDWQHDHINQVWLKHHADHLSAAPNTFYDAVQASRQLHPIAKMSAENCTHQLGVVGAWHERLPHFRIDALPSAGNELQTEYFVAREDAVAAIQAINAIRQTIAPHLLISEVRSIAADDLWMSPCYQQNSVALHFTWQQNWPAVSRVLPELETALAPFNARPHWGKLFTMSPRRLQSLYRQLPNFRDLLHHYDPHGKFRNAFLQSALIAD
jgi:alditol oxidase